MATTNPAATDTQHQPPPAARKLRIATGYLVGAACLAWVFHDLPLKQLAHTLAAVHWWRLAPGAALILAAYLCVAWEWCLLLKPAGQLPFLRTAQAVFAGRFANDVLPMQLGYLVRAFLASRWMRISLAATLPSLIVERLWDGLWLAAGIGLVSFFTPLPPDAVHARNVLAATVLGGTAAVVLLVLWRRRRHTAAPKTTPNQPNRNAFGRVRNLIGRLADGLHDIGRSGRLPAILALALLKLALQALAFLAILWAFEFPLTAGAGLAVFLAGYLGMCIPSTPASTGLFQVFVVATLGYFGIDKPAATGFSLIAFAVLTIPPATAGYFALAQTGLTLRRIRSEVGGAA